MKKYAIIGLGSRGLGQMKRILRTEEDSTIWWVADIEINKFVGLQDWTSYTLDYRMIDGVDCAIICVPKEISELVAKHFRDKGIETIVDNRTTEKEKIEEGIKDMNTGLLIAGRLLVVTMLIIACIGMLFLI